VLDFALALDHITAQLDGGAYASFDFTESDALIRFRRDGGHVDITCTYAAGSIRAEHGAFRAAVAAFVRRVVTELCDQFPGLAENPRLRSHVAAGSA
jgi:hypothetical protein